MQPQDTRDRLVMGLVTFAWGVATHYLYTHPSDVNYATWAGLAVTITGCYHWLMIRDQKTPDA